MTQAVRVVVAVDGSDAALHACRRVAAYAGDRSAVGVLLLNVQRPPLRLAPSAGAPYSVLEAALREEGEQLLQPARELLAAAGFAVESQVRIGPPADTVLDAARAAGATVLVMGNGREGLLRGRALGSVALRVAPAAPFPVVLVGAGMQLPAALGRSLRVLAPVDGSPESLQAVQRLVACAPLLGRLHVDLAHCQPGLSIASLILPPHDDALREWSGRESDAATHDAAQLLAAAGIPHEVHRLTGAPGTGIAAFAAERGTELVCMATRGTGAMHHLLMGSVALQTAQASGVPVVLMR
jgi:nucleotide-binding universal stress UspA family protein